MVDTLVPGTEFGGYEILEELGAGGMGRVYRARDVTLDRLVALKTLSPELATDPAYSQRFLKEARAAARLNHPNIVQIYGFGSVESTFYLAMEFIDGKSLGFYLKTTHWKEPDAVLITRQVCNALEAAHASGIVHRDIKPDNLILTSRGEVKVVDLGIAKRLGDDQSMTQTGSSMGTPHYIAPEQVMGRRDIDARADIYSLGATLYHLVTGHTPYTGSSGPHVMSMHLIAPLPDPRELEPSLSEGLCSVLRKMMAKDRDERYPDVHALDIDLYQLQVGGRPQPVEPRATAINSTYVHGADATVLERPGVGFDAEVLARIEEHLTAAVGPMARVLVRRSARTAKDLEALCDELAAQVEEGPQRDAFSRRCRRCAESPGRTGGTRIQTASASPSTTPRPATTPARGTALGSAPSAPALTDGELASVEMHLAQQIGPLAKVLVRRAARTAGSLRDLVGQLEPQLPDDASRRAFRRAVLGPG